MMIIVLSNLQKFPLGELVITANAQAQLEPAAVQQAITRHISGDWGEVCPSDAELNNEGLKHGDRLLSVYRGGETVFWIITESDRSVTTVLMPEDY